MVSAPRSLAPSLPWVLHAFDRARVAPVWSGLAVSAAWYGVFLLYTALLGDGVGRFDALGPGAWASELIWSLLIGLPPAVTAYMLRGAARDLDDLAPALLDRAQLAPFGRRGLRSVLLWMLLLSLFAPLYVLGAAEPLLVVALVFLVSFAATAFLLPVRGAHRRIAAAKEHELTRVRAALHEARSRVLAAPSDAVQGGRLADLVAWEQRVAAAREWPFGAPTVWRFALYTGIGLASWIGAALVERALDTALR